MARPYKDLAELRVELVDRSIHPLVEGGTVILLGIGFPAVDEPVPIMLSPGSEYRIRMVSHPADDETDDMRSIWIMERRAAGRDG